jgi:hypothetical protein
VAVAPDGRLVCSYIGRGGAGTSDYAVHLAESSDGGATWTDHGLLWPDDVGRASVTASIRAAPDGDLYLFGTITPIAVPGEAWWDPERGAMAQNALFWSRSVDGGRTWSARVPIPMPIPGSAEAPGPMLITRGGRWLVCYAPYPTFDLAVEVERAQIVTTWSDDRGATWQGGRMLRLPQGGGSAEAWAVELTDGRLFGACWSMDLPSDLDHPIPWAISSDGGTTWGPTRSTGIGGQAVGIAALDDGRAAMVYNQRDVTRPPVGVWLAVMRPTDDDAGVEVNAPIWAAAGAGAAGAAIGHEAWQTFTFGEPGAVVLPGGDLLATIWSGGPGQEGVVWVRVRLR